MKYSILLLLIGQLGYATDSLEISILTCSPGAEHYSSFGHSAIRVFDKETRTDKVYDFGAFDFDTPNFSYKFLRGTLQYYLALNNTNNYIYAYTYDHRLISEQKLNLSSLEKKQIIDRLHFLYQPENRYYLYSFIRKGCSTDIRDLLTFIGVKILDHPLKETHRDLVNSYLKEKPWLRLGINTMAGQQFEEKSSRFQSMFLPSYLEKEIDSLSINGKQLVKSKTVLNRVSIKSESSFNKLLSPLIIFSILAIISVFWLARPVKIAMCLFIGLAGLLMTLLLFFSANQAFANNLNILWCNPLYLFYIPLFLQKKTNRILTLILIVALILSVFVWVFKIQIFDISVIPIMFILGIINCQELKCCWLKNWKKNNNEYECD